jgi:hypothetical protein
MFGFLDQCIGSEEINDANKVKQVGISVIAITTLETTVVGIKHTVSNEDVSD